MRYDYDCEKCKKIFEVGMRLDDHGKEVKCPVCQEPMKQVLNVIPFRIR